MSILHDTDFYSWTQQQAALLRAGSLAALDISNLIEEIEDMGISQRRELEHRLAALLAHLLKWKYEPERQGKSWRLTIKEQRFQVQKCLRENPGLKSQKEVLFLGAYYIAKIQAARETSLDESIFPTTCPWTFEQIMHDEFWPE